MASSNPNNRLLADQARALFTAQAVRALPMLAQRIGEKLSELERQAGNARQTQEWRDAALVYQNNSAVWLKSSIDAFSMALASEEPAAPALSSDFGKLELMGNEVVENGILSSRLALRLLDFSSWELNDLRLRIQGLEGVSELRKQDIFRPEVLAQRLVEQWVLALLPQQVWLMVQEVVHKSLGEHMLEVYHATNKFLINHDVMAEIDLRPMVRRTASPASESAELAEGAGRTDSRMGSAPGSPFSSGLAPVFQSDGLPSSQNAPVARHTSAGDVHSSRGAWGTGQGVYDETRMQTATTPLARVRMRAQGVMGHLKRLLSSQVPEFDDTRVTPASSKLAQALVRLQNAGHDGAEPTLLADPQGQVYGQTHVDQALGSLRQRTAALKQAATTSAEKATIEIVALMFQSILAEDRIPPGIRVWFARLQMPVLRVAIAEPAFFGSLQHPARRLIDRMGSCALGFDVSVAGGLLELEIKRVVQVIEQYPETGRRVFQLVYDEFDKFLARFLAEQGSTARVVSVAQQIEQKETMVIQYTIEMRSMLDDMPVRQEIREFLFKVWAEVLALAAMKNGPQHEETLAFKRAAADLVGAASAKPNREDRARVISDLPALLRVLRRGMTLVGVGVAEQDQHLKVVSKILADAFMSKTDAIPMERIDAMAKRLSNLEDYLSDEDVGDLPLDTESLAMMTGIEAADIVVIADGGSQPTDAMRAWAKELQLGTWYTLDHSGQVCQVQFAWCSDRKQLHLFAAADGRNFLIQARRLAAYLQAGLLVPTEEEALTVRATRDALAKIDANPERLLS